MNLHETLKEYENSGIYPFHMPGHKRNLQAGGIGLSIDMTEVDGVDDLHDPEGPILEDQETFSKIYKSDRCFLLVGGSTSGNLAAIYATTKEGDKIIIQRNSHKSVYNAATLRHNRVSYITPELSRDGYYMSVSYEDVKNALDREPDAKAIVITSPTYEGYHAPIEEISLLCKKRDVRLIVDQAHGAHLGFHKAFKGQAAEFADITIMSLHKTLPALTQTALLHVRGKKVSMEKVQEALDIFETSSPSYVLMDSMSRCGEIMKDYPTYFDNYVDNLMDFYTKCGELKHLLVIIDDVQKKDPGKIVVSTKYAGITGVELAKRLREEYKIETELSSFSYVIAMTSIFDTKGGFDRLADALRAIDRTLGTVQINVPDIHFHPKKRLELWKAKAGEEKLLPLNEANGMISASMICIYPPGAPIVVPGEEITVEALALIEESLEKGLHITGLHGDAISVVN